MGSADFSQFVVTTADDTACETSTLKVHALSPHLSAAFTPTSSNFWASLLLANLPVFRSLICDSCPSDQGFAYSFLQIPPRDGHPCCSAMYFVVAYAYSGLSPVRARPWRANHKRAAAMVKVFNDLLPGGSPFYVFISLSCRTRRSLFPAFSGCLPRIPSL